MKTFKLVSKKSDIFYLLGKKIDHDFEIIVLISDEQKSIIITDPRNSFELQKKFGDKYIVLGTRDAIIDFYQNNGLKFVVEKSNFTKNMEEYFMKFGIEIEYGEDVLSQERLIKKDEEIQKLFQSQQINVKALNQTIDEIKLGMSEYEVELLIKINLLKNGATDFSFTPVVGFGEGSGDPHHTNRKDRKLVNGDLILIDMGGVYDGYASDITRVFFTKKPDDKIIEQYKLLQSIVKKIIVEAKVGMKFFQLDDIARQMLGNYTENFTHSLGHGIGIDVHERPWVNAKSVDEIQNGMVFTLEPGIYFPGNYGLRFEEMVYVKNDRLHLVPSRDFDLYL